MRTKDETTGTDLQVVLALDRRAVRSTLPIAAAVRPEDLDRATPCAGWTVRDLLAHMTVQHHGFAAAARGQGQDRRHWAPRRFDHPVAAYRAAAEDVLAAFAAGPLPDFALPEIRDGGPFPAELAIGFHFLDYAVHGWDLARALARPYRLDPDLAAPLLRRAEAVPGGAARLAQGAAFRPALPAEDTDDDLARILRLLGRDPDWPGTAVLGG